MNVSLSFANEEHYSSPQANAWLAEATEAVSREMDTDEFKARYQEAIVNLLVNGFHIPQETSYVHQ